MWVLSSAQLSARRFWIERRLVKSQCDFNKARVGDLDTASGVPVFADYERMRTYMRP
jgi:hypothetical protein